MTPLVRVVYQDYADQTVYWHHNLEEGGVPRIGENVFLHYTGMDGSRMTGTFLVVGILREPQAYSVAVSCKLV